MDKTTQEMFNRINTLVTFNDNLILLIEQFPQCEQEIDLLIPYVDHQIKKTLQDIIHIERL